MNGETPWKAFSLRLPPDLVERIDELAKADHRPRSNWIEVQLRKAVTATDELNKGLRPRSLLPFDPKDGTP